MMKLSTLVLVPFAFSIAACGGSGGSSNNSNGPIDDKESAAGAAYRVQNTNDDVHNRSGRGLSPAQLPNVPGTGGEVTVTVQGERGSAEVTEKTVIGMEGIMAEFTVKYVGYSGDGVNTLDGEVTQTALVSSAGGNAEVSTTVRGTLDITGGELDSHLVVDVSTGVSVSGASASVTVDGSINADGVTYEYNGDRFDFTTVAF